jgi:hypothetical protein
LGNEAHRILIARFVLQVGKGTVPMCLVVDDLRHRGLQAEIAAVTLDARVIGEAVRVARGTRIIISLSEITRRYVKVRLVIAAEPALRNHVEDAVGAATFVRHVTAPFDTQRLYVQRIDRGAED